MTESESSTEPVLESSSQPNTEPSQSVLEANEGDSPLDESLEALEGSSVVENGTGESSESDTGELIQNGQESDPQQGVLQGKTFEVVDYDPEYFNSGSRYGHERLKDMPLDEFKQAFTRMSNLIESAPAVNGLHFMRFANLVRSGSMKDRVHKGFIVFLATALMTSFLVSCKPMEVDVSGISMGVDVQDDTGGTKPSESMHLLYWYESPEVQEFVGTDVIVLRETGEQTRTIVYDMFKVYADAKGEYIISGSTQVYLVNRKIPADAIDNLRLEETCQRLYVEKSNVAAEVRKTNAEAFHNLLKTTGETQPVNLAERSQRYNSTASDLNGGLRMTNPVYLNNEQTKIPASLMGIQASDLMRYTSAFKVTEYGTNEVKFTVQTGAGLLEGVLTFDDFGVIQTAEVGNVKPDVSNSLTLYNHGNQPDLRIDIMDICDILGWDVEVYPKTGIINIVTDSKDLVTDNIIVMNNDFMPVINTSPEQSEPSEESQRYMSEEGMSSESFQEIRRLIEEKLKEIGKSWDDLEVNDSYKLKYERKDTGGLILDEFNDKNNNGIADYIEEGRPFDILIDGDPSTDYYKVSLVNKLFADEMAKAKQAGRFDEFMENRSEISKRIREQVYGKDS